MESKAISDIITSRDEAAFANLSEYEMSDCFIELMYNHFYSMEFEAMNHTQKTLFLCMVLEDHCQADGILSLTEEENLFFLMPEMKGALTEISAVKTAQALQEFIDYMPQQTFENHIIPEWDWFMDEKNSEVIESIDSKISNYPDGLLRVLYREYVLTVPGAVTELLQI